MNMNMNMMNYNMQNELLKAVLEGMGEEASEDISANYDAIFNYVPNIGTSGNYNNSLGIGKIITLCFAEMSGGEKKMEIGEDTPLKEAFYEYGKICGISNEEIKKFNFLCDGKLLNVNSKGTIKGNNIKEGKTIVVNRPFDES